MLILHCCRNRASRAGYNNHDPARLVIALHKKAPVTVSRPGAFIKRSVACHSPRPLFPLPR